MVRIGRALLELVNISEESGGRVPGEAVKKSRVACAAALHRPPGGRLGLVGVAPRETQGVEETRGSRESRRQGVEGVEEVERMALSLTPRLH
jgi:hypothetical protein